MDDHAKQTNPLNTGKKKRVRGFPNRSAHCACGTLFVKHTMRFPLGAQPFPSRNSSMLNEHYIPILAVHSATAIAAKFSLIVGLLLVQLGTSKKGPPLMTGILLVHFLIATFTTPGQTFAMNLLSFVSGVMVLACGWTLAQGAAWRALPDAQPAKALTLMGYFAIIWFPLWPAQGFVKALFVSPMGVIPHQDLLAILLLCHASGARAPRILAIAAAVGALMVAIAEFKWGTAPRAIIMLVAALAGGVTPLLAFSRNAATDIGDAIKSRSENSAVDSAEDAPRKKWDLR